MIQDINYKSVKDVDWRLKRADEIIVSAIKDTFEVSEIIARLLVIRKIPLEEIENYLNPTLKAYLPDPLKLKDMEQAIQSLAEAIVNKRKIAIFGDYDVDGATSSALLYKFFYFIGCEVEIYIPDRIIEGYGPNSNALLSLQKKGYEVIVTVDCGISAFEQMEFAESIGLQVIIIDHHLPTSLKLPLAKAIVNPNRLDDTSGYNYLAAVGVCFLLLVALKTYLIKHNFMAKDRLPNLLEFLDLVALGTVCDVVPLIGVNRAFVVQGLKIIGQKKNHGLSALIDISTINEQLSVYHLGFLLGPRVNAGGRVGKADYGSKLLTTLCTKEASHLSYELNIYNQERKTIEEFVLDEAVTIAEIKNKNNQVLVIAGKKWHPGVIGIVASRIKEMFNKPVAVISCDDGLGKASCRSVKYFDFGNSIVKAKEKNLIIVGGGHKMAAGFTIQENFIDQLEEFLNIAYSEQIINHKDYGIESFEGYLSASGINIELIEKLSLLGPFGAGNTEPKFMIKNCNLINIQIMKDKHIAATIGEINSRNGDMFRATCFNVIGTTLGDNLLSLKGKSFHLIGTIKKNNWQNRIKAEFQIIDLVIA